MQPEKGPLNEPGTDSSAKLPELPLEPVYCHCKGSEDGNMVECENNNCKYGEWVHYLITMAGSNSDPNRPSVPLPMCQSANITTGHIVL